MLRPAISHLGGEKAPVSEHNSIVETVSQTDGNTEPLQAKSEFIKSTWRSRAPFTETIPWGTAEFLNLYPIKNNKLAHSTPSQPNPTVKNRANNTQKPVEIFGGGSKPKASKCTDINYAGRIMNWDKF